MSTSTILVIGNNAHFGYLMQRYISQSDHRGFFINPGTPVWTAILQEKPAAIILEITSPGIEELSLLHTLKTDSSTCEIPVVICSWHDDHYPGEEMADGYLHMPALYEEFIKALTYIGL